jgi:hypothetical protein
VNALRTEGGGTGRGGCGVYVDCEGAHEDEGEVKHGVNFV